MKLTFSVFSVEPSTCDYMIYNYPEDYNYEDYCHEGNTECSDYVEVSYGSFNEKFCGSEVPGPITSTDNTMTVKFHSDDATHSRGFSATWEAVSSSPSLPGTEVITGTKMFSGPVTLAAASSLSTLNTISLGTSHSGQAFTDRDTSLSGHSVLAAATIRAGHSLRAESSLALTSPTLSPEVDLEWLHNNTVLRSEDTALISGRLRFARDLRAEGGLTVGHLATADVLVAVPGDLIPLSATTFQCSLNGMWYLLNKY